MLDRIITAPYPTGLECDGAITLHLGYAPKYVGDGSASSPLSTHSVKRARASYQTTI